MSEPVGGPIDDLVEAKLRNGLRQLVQDGFTGSHACEAAVNAVGSLRRLAERLSISAVTKPWLDRLEATAREPENGEAIAEDIRGLLLPFLK